MDELCATQGHKRFDEIKTKPSWFVIKHFAGQLGGKGGGRPDMAQGGGSDVAALPAVLASLPEWVSSQLS